MHRFHRHRFERAARSPESSGRHAFFREAFERHGRGRRRRIFDQGDLRYVLLRLIADKPSHGYELIKEIEERVGGAYSPSPGVIYPTLTLLEELGWIRGQQTEGARKAYEITDEGRAELEARKAQVEDIFRRVGEFAKHGLPPHQILRALQNLRVALRLRLERGPLGEQLIDDVAAALDAAAQSLERD